MAHSYSMDLRSRVVADVDAGLNDTLLDAVASHRVADRPDRFEPRQSKRRQQKYDRMVKPRNQLKREMLERLK